MLVLSLVVLLAASSLSSPARVLKQRVQKFKNFPVVGIKENDNIDTFDEQIVNEEPSIEHPRDARQVDNYSTDFSDSVDDLFVEEAVYLSPEDREARSVDPDGRIRTLEEDPAAFLFDEVDENEQVRAERDGAHGHHGSNHRGGRAQQRAPAPVAIEYDDEYDYDYQEPARAHAQPQQQRRGKQTGATGVALGVLSSPPSSDGNYNFK